MWQDWVFSRQALRGGKAQNVAKCPHLYAIPLRCRLTGGCAWQNNHAQEHYLASVNDKNCPLCDFFSPPCGRLCKTVILRGFRRSQYVLRFGVAFWSG
jgi:hypothetical protein